jgi:hypothetical protein
VGQHNHELFTFACLYRSVAGQWGEPAKLDGDAAATTDKDKRPGVLVGNAAYFTCQYQLTWQIMEYTERIVEYDMGRAKLSVIDLPPVDQCEPGTVLTATKDGQLGFAGLNRRSLYLWSREPGPDGALAWTRRVIELEKMLLHFLIGTIPVFNVPSLIGFDDGAGVVFVTTEVGRVFSVDLKSGRYLRTSFPRFHGGEAGQEPLLILYTSFYTPGTTGTDSAIYYYMLNLLCE